MRRLGAGERDGVIVGSWGVVGGSGTRCVSASDARGVVRVPRRCAGPGGGVAAARRTNAREDTYCISERFLFPVRWYQRRSEVVARQEWLLGEVCSGWSSGCSGCESRRSSRVLVGAPCDRTLTENVRNNSVDVF